MASIAPKTAKKNHKGTMFGIPITDWLTYTNAAYLVSLLLTFALTVTLWRVSVAAQNESELKLEQYKSEAAARVSEANARADVARADAAKALVSAAQAEQRAAEANARAAVANLEILKIKTPRTLDDNGRQAIVAAARLHPGTCFASGVRLSDPEAMRYLGQIESVLVEAGWVHQDWNDNTAIVIYRSGAAQTGQFAGEGAGVLYHKGSSKELAAAARAVSTAMGIAPSADLSIEDSVAGPATDCVRLVVGMKQL